MDRTVDRTVNTNANTPPSLIQIMYLSLFFSVHTVLLGSSKFLKFAYKNARGIKSSKRKYFEKFCFYFYHYYYFFVQVEFKRYHRFFQNE